MNDAVKVRPITIAILAMGGEGGGVLSDWIVDLAEHGGYLAQATSIPGVAQRTGATIYYLELFPKAAARAAGKQPVLALMPVPGDVDVVLASELMEAGRAIQRGFVTPDRTTLIASTHRVYAMTERIALDDGRVDAGDILQGCQAAAKRLYAFDMAALAEASGSVISAVLFGALAGSGVLPFQRMAFEAAIRRGGVGVAASVAAFGAAFEAAQDGAHVTPMLGASWQQMPPSSALPPQTLDGRDADAPRPATGPAAVGIPSDIWRQVQDFSEPAGSFVRAGVDRVIDYQDSDYARLYLQRLQDIRNIERRRGDGSGRLLAETARQLALGMSYEDTLRVAELKIRPDRFQRVREEVRLGEGQLLDIAEFLHPRVQEIADTLPERLGRWLLNTGWARRIVERFTRKGRVLKTSTLRGFLLLYVVAAMKPMRRGSLRYQTENALLERWLESVRSTGERDYALAVEVAECRNLVKGYGDTHERGRTRFETLMRLLPQIANGPAPAATLASLRKAALADENGAALAAAIRQMPLLLPQAAE
jgi:indolepyruvate ferredoxin oxidoreductase beta subunit